MRRHEIKAVHLKHEDDIVLSSSVERFGPDCAKRAMEFHRSFPEYSATPLVELGGLAKNLGVASIHVKDESFRFGLNAFKVLGGSYAIGRYIAKELGMSIADLPYEKLISPEIKEKLGELCFVTATDGNHGRGVAWTARRLGQKCVVYMPKGSAAERVARLMRLPVYWQDELDWLRG